VERTLLSAAVAFVSVFGLWSLPLPLRKINLKVVSLTMGLKQAFFRNVYYLVPPPPSPWSSGIMGLAGFF
jgi:hypothetical protein